MTKRGKTPSLISGLSGKPIPEKVKKKRTCNRCSCDIMKGQNCFLIPKLGSGFSNKKPFCKSCFKETLDQTRKDLDSLVTTWHQLYD
ncbi:MAG: hypothetical protein KAW12_16000 [Candidatus Aminicenantes bacterium]|nr:hypothetical protein [Candidatus Aminicenantes bacterium]